MSPKEPEKRPVTNRRSTVIAAVVLVLVAGVVIGGVIMQSSRNKPRNEDYGTVRKATVQLTGGVVRVGAADAPVTIDIYEDFLCPVCGQFEKIYGQELAQALDDGKVAAVYHMLDFLNPRSAPPDKNYSTRAAAAALCVAADGGTAFPQFHSALFSAATQPKEGSGSDLSNADLAERAKAAGASMAAQSCITSGAKLADAVAAAQAGENELTVATGQVGTPTVLKAGKPVDVQNSSWIAQLS